MTTFENLTWIQKIIVLLVLNAITWTIVYFTEKDVKRMKKEDATKRNKEKVK